MSEHRVSRNLAVVALASAVALTTASAWGSQKGAFFQPGVSASAGISTTGGFSTNLGLPSDIDDVSVQSGPEAVKSWAAAASGNWGTAGSWNPAVIPNNTDNILFNQNATYTVTVPAGAVANDVRVAQGNVTLTGGTITTSNTTNPGVGPATATPAGTSLIVAGSAQATISGGMTFNYLQGYVGEAVGNTATLTVAGAGTLVTTSSANALANGRFGMLSGNTTLNVTTGATVRARLFEFGRQDGVYTATVNVNGGTLGTIEANPVLDPQAYAQIVLPRGIGATLNMNVTNNGQVNVGTLFSGAVSPTIATTGKMTVNSAGSTVRINNVAVVNGGNVDANGNIVPGYNGTTTFDILAGTLSVGRLNSNQNGGIVDNIGASNAVYNVTGPTAKLEIKDANEDALAASYISMGQGDWSTDVINVTGGGDVVVTDTGATEDDTAFVSGSSHTRSTITVDGAGSTFTVDDELDVGGVGQDTATGLYGEDAVGIVNVKNGASFTIVEGNSFFAVDPGNTATLNVETGGTFSLTGQWTLGGGNQNDFDGVGSGNSNVNVLSGGSATTGHIIIAQDDGDGVVARSLTNITVSGANSKLDAAGLDDSFTEFIDSGFIGDGGSYSDTNVMVSAGGLMKARYLINFGAGFESTATVTVTGDGSVIDAGGQFSLGGGENNTAILNIANGGLVKTTSSVDTIDLAESIFLGTEAITGSTVTVNLLNSLPGVNPPQSRLESVQVIWVGGTFGAELVLGIPTNINGQANTQIRYGAQIYLAPGSSITTAGTLQYTGLLADGGGTFLDSGATINGAGVSHVGWLGIDNTDATFNGKLTLAAVTGNAVVAASRIELSGGGKINVGKSDALVLHPTEFPTDTDPIPAQTLADIKPLIIAGYAGGTWNPADGVDAIYGSDIVGQNPKRGIGYTVATAAGNFLGEPVAVGDILIRNTLLGDANLDGTVNFTDLLALAQSYNLTGKNWNQGDFNYSANGLVNFDDLLPTAQNYNVSLLADGSLSGEGMGFTPEFQAEWAFALASVPEPTTLAALAGVGLLALRRRK